MKLENAVPPQSLLEELEEVAEYSSKLIGAIRSANGIPKAFPKEAVFDLCTGLEGLQHGTAEGCRVPLEYARSRLPAIRRQFIFREEDQIHDELTGDEPPPLMRGMAIDLAFQSLIAAITTALDEYRRLAAEEHIETISVDQEFDSTGISKSQVVSESVAVGKLLAEKEIQIQSAIEPGSTAGQNLARSLRDADNVNKLARSEVKQTLVVVRWLQALSKRMISLPTIFRKMSGFVKLSADIVQPLRKQWTETLSEIEDLLFRRYRKLGEAFGEIADTIEQKGSKEEFALANAPSEPDIDHGFEHWVLSFVAERSGSKQGIDAALFYPEVKHLTGMTSSEFAKRRGYASFKDLLKSLPLVKLFPHGSTYEVRVVDGQERQKALRQKKEHFLWRFGQLLLHVSSQKRRSGEPAFVSSEEMFRFRWVSIDDWASYMKITNGSLKDVFESVSGVKYISDVGGGTFEVTNPQSIIASVYPKHFHDRLTKLYI